MYTVTALRPLPGDNYCSPKSINSFARIVGSSSSASGGRAVLWGSSFRPVDLEGTLVQTFLPHDLHPIVGNNAKSSEARDINDGGEIVGLSRTHPDAQGNVYSSAFKLAVGQSTVLPPLTGDSRTWGESINSAGDLVGGSSPFSFPGIYLKDSRAVLWSGTSPADLGHAIEDSLGPGGGWYWGYYAKSINKHGVVCGVAHDPGPLRYHAFRWDANNGLKLLPPLDGLGAWSLFDAYAFALNDSGTIVGWSENHEGVGQPTMWPPGQGATLIFDGLESGGSSFGINKYGSSVGAFKLADGTVHAWLWNGSFHDLNDLIDPASGWTLRNATGINDRGQIIGIGDYRDPSNSNASPISQGFLATPPPRARARRIELEHWVQQILTGQAGEPGVVIPPGQGPTPWPPRGPESHVYIPVGLRGLVSALRVLYDARGITDDGAREKIDQTAEEYLKKELAELLRSLDKG